jgi:DNA-binding XRE family transcriptional regulator
MDDKTSKLEAIKYIAVSLEEDGKMLGNLMMPADSIEGLPEDEVTRLTLAAYRRLQAAERILNQTTIREAADADGPKLLQSLARIAAGTCAFDILTAWKERALHDAAEAAYLKELATKPGALKRVLDETTKLLGAMLLEMLEETNEAQNLHNWLWQHLIAGAMEELEKEHGAESIATMGNEIFGELLHKQLYEKQDVGAAAANLLAIRGQDLGRDCLETLDLPNRSLQELRELLGLESNTADTDLQGAMQVRAERFEDFFSIPSGAPYYALQEIMATKDFRQLDGIPWPTALINKKSAKGTAQLRPAAMDENPLMAPDEVDAWAKIMWRTRDQLSDLDVDVMDSLAAVYLQQTRKPGESAAVDIDDILAMRGLKPKRGGSGTRGGYTPKQRQEAQAALARIQSIWLDMAEVDAYEDTERGGRRRSRKTIQSRPFVISDRMGQMRLDGFMDVERFIFRPGEVFAHYLHGPGRQTALLNAKILNFDPYRETWEKRLGRYLTNLWRIRARVGACMEPLRIQTLLKVVDQELNSRRGGWIRERLEKALDALLERGIINAWQYDRWDEDTTQQRNWFESWMQATVLIEPPAKIEEHYQELERPAKAEALQATSKEPLGTRLKARRQQLGLTQLQAAEKLEVSQGYYSQLERGKNRAKPGAALGNRIDKWLGES